jgi:hypothetical protein
LVNGQLTKKMGVFGGALGFGKVDCWAAITSIHAFDSRFTAAQKYRDTAREVADPRRTHRFKST